MRRRRTLKVTVRECVTFHAEMGSGPVTCPHCGNTISLPPATLGTLRIATRPGEMTRQEETRENSAPDNPDDRKEL